MQIKEYDNQKVNNPQKVAEIFQAILASEDVVDRDKEHFWVMGINSASNVKFIELVSLGTAKASLVGPVEVFRLSVMLGASTIIIAHNHPSGSLEVSDDDIKITERLIQAGKILNVAVSDHIIITNSEHLSFREKGTCCFI